MYRFVCVRIPCWVSMPVVGSREQKRWYSGVCGTEESENKKLLTVVSL